MPPHMKCCKEKIDNFHPVTIQNKNKNETMENRLRGLAIDCCRLQTFGTNGIRYHIPARLDARTLTSARYMISYIFI